jgi:hypothetical protein
MKQLFNCLIVFLLLSCGGNFSKGVKKDMTTGLASNYNGFAVDDIYLTDKNGTKLNSNKIVLGDEIMVIASGVDNYKLVDGKAFPGCTIILTDKNKKEILNLPDAFSSLNNGVSASEATELKATLTTGAPMQAGETYQLYVHFFDKKQTTSVITSTVDIVMK